MYTGHVGAKTGSPIFYEKLIGDESISFVAYKSSRGDFNPKPGDAGLNLNGHGPLNENSFAITQIRFGTQSIALLGKGKNGKRVFIFESSLPVHLFETVTFEDKTIKAYGGQIYVVKLDAEMNFIQKIGYFLFGNKPEKVGSGPVE